MPLCTPLRVDHLDGNTGINNHEIGRFIPDSANDRIWITYCNLKTTGTFRGGIYLRSYNYVTKTLGTVRTVQNENPPAARLGALGDDNRSPHAVRLNDGRFIVMYNGDRTGNSGVLVRESTDEGATWTPEVLITYPHFIVGYAWGVVSMWSDGVDVFAVAKSIGGGSTGAIPNLSNGDLILLRRNTTGDWRHCRIFDTPSGGDTVSFGGSADLGTQADHSLWFEKVSSGPDTWRMFLVFKHRPSPSGPDTVVCLQKQAHTTANEGGDEASSWTKVVVASFGTDTEERAPLAVMGTDGRARMLYIDDVGGVSKPRAAWTADYGQSWTDIGQLTVPSASFWDVSYSRTMWVDQNKWLISTIEPDGAALLRRYTVYRGTTDDNANWSQFHQCDVDTSGEFTVGAANGVGEMITIEGRMLRLLSSAEPGNIYNLWLLDEAAPAQPAAPPCPGDSVNNCPGTPQLFCGPDGVGYTYSWRYPNGSIRTTQCIVATDPGIYTLTVTDTGTGLTSTCNYILNEVNCPPGSLPPPPEPNVVRIFRRGMIRTESGPFGRVARALENQRQP